ncbi:MAG: hypothetical protein ACI4HQ_11130 [Acetatifactor sp.]
MNSLLMIDAGNRRSLWKRGETIPDTDKIIDLSDLYGVSCDYLLRGMKQTTG